jgi:RNA polymerase sigma-54 factor
MTSPSAEEERIGSLIIGNLNRDGYMEISVEELAEMSGSPEEKAQEVLEMMQTFDPVGVCARDLRECLLIQARYLEVADSLVLDIIGKCLTPLENRNFKAICKTVKASIEEVTRAINVIQSLEPKPGRQYSDEEPQYITPDIYVHKLGDEFVIWINDDGLPKLRVSNFYRDALKGGKKLPDKARDYVQEKMRSAAWLIRSIHQRQKTIYRVMESILKFQRDFFENGISHLKPLVLREVAEDIGMHESTISRVTTNKYTHTPQGIFELKYFFNSSIQRVHGEAIASASVQDKIRQIIDSENPRKPFSDDKIAKMLKASNINIARRTVAKYREMMKVLPSNKRKQL